MPRVQCSIQDMPSHTYVIFIDRQRQAQLGPMRRYSSHEPVMEILRRAHADLATVNLVERSLAEGRPCTVELNLSDAQFAAIQTRRKERAG
jgi:hypothetical protein